jgi:hypothetical protein
MPQDQSNINPAAMEGEDPWDALAEAEDDQPRLMLVDAGDAPVPPVFDEADLGDNDASEAADANEHAVSAAVAEIASVPQPTRGGAFTIPALCAGIAIIAACLLIPQADANRRLAYERTRLQADLAAVEKQVGVNDEFLRKVADDPNLAERLAQRQMKIIREGNAVLNLKSDGGEEMSPFQLTAVAPAAQFPPYQPRGGILANLCYNPHTRLYLMGIGLMAMAGGLVLGFGPRDPN